MGVFPYGYGGIGKTFMWNKLLVTFHSKRIFVLRFQFVLQKLRFVTQMAYPIFAPLPNSCIHMTHNSFFKKVEFKKLSYVTFGSSSYLEVNFHITSFHLSHFISKIQKSKQRSTIAFFILIIFLNYFSYIIFFINCISNIQKKKSGQSQLLF